jgi:oligopeptide/dipeptide ABC transporter ATP-binding protein
MRLRTSGFAGKRWIAVGELLEVEHLSVDFHLRRGRRRGVVRAVRDVSLSVRAGRTLGVVGESGSGKTTLARAVLGLVPISAGHVAVDGLAVGDRATDELDLRRRMQVVLQDPTSSLDPLRTIAHAIGEPLRVHTDLSGDERRSRIEELLELVGLDPTSADRLPRQLSGGQRQRVNIARAMSVRPKLIILDEPISALDLSTQSQILNLLERLQDESGAGYLLIAHDLAAVLHASDDIAVMYLGQVVEYGDAEAIYAEPKHPYTQALIAAAPVADPDVQRERRRNRRRLVHGELPSPLSPPSGCSFHTRCSYAFDRCTVEAPEQRVLDDGRLVSCHLVETTLVAEPSRRPDATDASAISEN